MAPACAFSRRFACCVKDIEFTRREIVVRGGKGAKDRITMLPRGLASPLRAQLMRAAEIHERDLAAGYGEVHVPHALQRKYRNAAREWPWQTYSPPIVSRAIHAPAWSVAII